MELKLLPVPKENEMLDAAMPALDRFTVAYDFEEKKLVYEPAGKAPKGSNYVISRDLVKAVNAAIVTGRPLLLKGDPGCGKTKLAKAVAAQLFEKEEVNRYYFEWFVKSKSRAKEGCYDFDHIQRLRDATIAATDDKAKANVESAENYLSLGPLGKALTATPPIGRSILLIDEIDKGDIDFPNDLLLELDELRFTIKEKDNMSIPEVQRERPLVFITSNDERELPPAFLRRCLIYRIPSFGPEILLKIVNSKKEEMFAALNLKKAAVKKALNLKALVDEFVVVRKSSVATNPPSTSELLDWVKLIAFKLNDGGDFKELLKDKDLKKLALKMM